MRLGYANAGSSVKSAIGTYAMTKKAACTLDNQQQKQHAKVPLVAHQKITEDRDYAGVFTDFNHSGLLRKNVVPNWVLQAMHLAGNRLKELPPV